MDPVGIPVPQEVPRVISTSMGTVFGGETQGFKISMPITPMDQSKPVAVAKSPQEVINETVTTLQAEVKELRDIISKMQVTMSAAFLGAVERSKKMEPLIIKDGNIKSLTADDVAPVKKGRGRPKKVTA